MILWEKKICVNLNGRNVISIASGDGIMEQKQVSKWYFLKTMDNSENSNHIHSSASV